MPMTPDAKRALSMTIRSLRERLPRGFTPPLE
jgi:hypothetical protein